MRLIFPSLALAALLVSCGEKTTHKTTTAVPDTALRLPAGYTRADVLEMKAGVLMAKPEMEYFQLSEALSFYEKIHFGLGREDFRQTEGEKVMNEKTVAETIERGKQVSARADKSEGFQQVPPSR